MSAKHVWGIALAAAAAVVVADKLLTNWGFDIGSKLPRKSAPSTTAQPA